MKTATANVMAELNSRVTAAVERSVAKGVDRKEAFKNHMMTLATEYPSIFGAYVKWLAAK